jgi:hypothetical protein
MSRLDFELEELRKAKKEREKARKGSNVDKAIRKEEAVMQARQSLQDQPMRVSSGETPTESTVKQPEGSAASSASKASAIAGAAGMLSSKGGGQGLIGGGAQGASTGFMVGGAPGAIVGGAVGAGLGVLKSKQAQRQAKQELENKKLMAKANIEDQKTQRIQNALQSLQSSFTSSLLSSSGSIRI